MKFRIYLIASLFAAVVAFDRPAQMDHGPKKPQKPNLGKLISQERLISNHFAAANRLPPNSFDVAAEKQSRFPAVSRTRREIDDRWIDASFAVGGAVAGFVPGGSLALTMVQTIYNLFKDEKSVWSQIRSQVRNEIREFISEYHEETLADKLDYYGVRLKEFALEANNATGDDRAEFLGRLRAFYENILLKDENTFDPTRRSSVMKFNLVLFEMYTAHVFATKTVLVLLLDQCNQSKGCNAEQYRRWLREKERQWIQFATVTGPTEAKRFYYSKTNFCIAAKGKTNSCRTERGYVRKSYLFLTRNHRGEEVLACVKNGTHNSLSTTMGLWEYFQWDAERLDDKMGRPVQALAGRGRTQISSGAFGPFGTQNYSPALQKFPTSRSGKQCRFFCRKYLQNYKWCVVDNSWDYCDDGDDDDECGIN